MVEILKIRSSKSKRWGFTFNKVNGLFYFELYFGKVTWMITC